MEVPEDNSNMFSTITSPFHTVADGMYRHPEMELQQPYSDNGFSSSYFAESRLPADADSYYTVSGHFDAFWNSC